MNTEDEERRASLRLPIELDVNVDHPRSRRRLTAELTELSPEGCRILTTETFEPAGQLLIRIAGLEPWPARVVWAKDGAVGVQFHKRLNPAVVEHHSLQFPKGAKEEARLARLKRRQRPAAGAGD